jgi:short-subunit dehydrogenase
MTQTALVTGASSGIGMAIARSLGSRRFDLVLVARRQDRLASLAQELSSTCSIKVDVVAADLGQREGCDLVIKQLGDRVVDVVVNNAGAGWIGLFHEAPAERQTEIVDVNCRAVIALTRAFLPGMIERRRGHIVQIASVAGFMPGPRSSTYYASKAFVVSHSEALRHELKGTGVAVTLVCPGPVATEFQRSSGVKGTMGGAVAMSDVDVAEASVDAMLAGRFLVVPGAPNALLVALSRVLPRQLTAALVDRLQKKRLAAEPVDVA